MNTKPVLLVDVDGVLNCFGSLWTPEYEAEHFEPIRHAHDGLYAIRVRTATREHLAQLALTFEMRWGTAWEDAAHPFFGEWLGLGDTWPHLSFKGAWGEGGTWKLPTVIEAFDTLEPDRPMAWIDDDLGGDAYGWARERVRRGVPTLLVKTNPCDGLVDKHVEQLECFAETLTDVAA